MLGPLISVFYFIFGTVVEAPFSKEGRYVVRDIFIFMIHRNFWIIAGLHIWDVIVCRNEVDNCVEVFSLRQ